MGFGVVAVLSLSSLAWADWSDTLRNYSCIEVEKFAVDRETQGEKKEERAASIPDEILASLQRKIVTEISKEKLISQVVTAGGGGCTGSTLVLGGKVSDFRKGNKALRYIIGFGAGKRKFEVESYVKDKSNGNTLIEKKISDSKSGGWLGGSDDKGERDFAEKVAKFIKKGK
jgi:hypothetical protein